MVVQGLIDGIQLLLALSLQRYRDRDKIAVAAALLSDIALRIELRMGCNYFEHRATKVGHIATQRLDRKGCRKLDQRIARHGITRNTAGFRPMLFAGNCLQESS